MRSSARQYAWLALALGVAACLRFTGLGAFEHPDERSVLGWVRRISWPELDPERFNYPSVFFYQLAAIGNFVPGGVESFDAMLLASRSWAALLSTLAVAAAWALGRETGGAIVAAYAAVGLAVLDIVVLRSHYALTDIPALLPAIVCLWLAMRGLRLARFRELWLAAITGGFAVSTKYNAASVLVAPALCAVALSIRRREGIGRTLLRPLGLALAAVLAFLVGTPYALLTPRRFWSDLSYVGRMQAEGRGGIHMEPAIRTLPEGLLGYPAVVTAELGLGILALAALGGLTLVPRLKRRLVVPAHNVTVDPIAVGSLVAATTAAYALLATSNALERHYVLFAYPPLLTLAGLGALLLARRIGTPPRRVALVTALVGLATLGPLAWHSLATVRVLTRTDSRILATEWFARHEFPPESIGVELYSGRAAGGATFESFLADRPLTSYCRSGVNVLAINSINERRRAAPRDRRWYERLREHGEMIQRFPGSAVPHLDRFPGGSVLHHDPTIEIYRLRCERLFAARER